MTGLALSGDALRVAVGTEAGSLGVLDIPSHAYATQLRSHCGAVTAVAADPCRWGGATAKPCVPAWGSHV